MAERPSHKRTKSALALSLLHRDKSRTEDKDPNAPSSSTISDTDSPIDSPQADSPTASNLSSLPQLRPVRSNKLQPDPPRSDGPGVEGGEAPADQRTNTDGDLADSGFGQRDMSIEQSVKTFRIFEALRSGDTNAISKAIKDSSGEGGGLQGTTVLHLAIQCADPQVVEYVLSTSSDTQGKWLDINARDKEGNTPIHLAAQLGRAPIVQTLLDQDEINDSLTNYRGRTPLDLARTPEIFQLLHLARSIFLENKTQEIHNLVAKQDYDNLEKLLVDPRVEAALDVNNLDLATDLATVQTGGTLLHEAARKRDTKLAQLLLMHGADPFRRDRRGKLPQDVTKDDRTRGILKKSPAAVIAQRGIQEKAILGNTSSQRVSGPGGVGDGNASSKDAREMKGYLKKWTNYTSGYKLRWFVLEDGVLSYYKHQDDAGSACRGAINMRIARLHMDAQDKTRFEIHGKSSVKYHLKANHVVEAKRWFWALNNAIQWTKDEAREEDKRKTREADLLRAKMDASQNLSTDTMNDSLSVMSNKPTPSTRGLTPPIHTSASKVSFHSARGPESAGNGDDFASAYDSPDASMAGDMARIASNTLGTTTLDGDPDDDDDEYGDDASSHEMQPATKDAFNITAQSAKVQLDLLAQVSSALQREKMRNPGMIISDPTIDQALSAYQGAVSSLNTLVADLLKISRDRDAFWQYRLDREVDARKMWEDSMARVAKEHEELQNKIGESEDKRKRTKRALKEALEGASAASTRPVSRGQSTDHIQIAAAALERIPVTREGRASIRRKSISSQDPNRRKSIIAQFTDLSDSESGDDEEFFDAIDAGEVEVVEDLPLTSPPLRSVQDASGVDERDRKKQEIVPSFRGYEDGIRKKMKLDADNRPKISLWGILKSMIGKDMTKMTLPVSFNEPTSLLQRVAEDMEYADLLDIAADRTDSSERMVYVAAFAASEYASTIGRVAKPFNPLLGETYEYVRPDKGYRFFIEQVSHHPPIGAAYAESPRWEYYGESAVKSKFYGRSFDINPLGTWFLKLRPISGGPPELYTWKKVTSSVVGIITGNPTVDNYGPMEVKNWSTGELCVLDFKQRGWKASSAFQVSGKVLDSTGKTRWSIGGRWNDKIYARLTPGFEGSVTPPTQHGVPPTEPTSPGQAFLVWEAHSRPTGIPFNLTPFVVSLNAIPDALRQHIPPTDTRLRPDQRAMEDGEYDFAATEKNRVEEKQRAKRRARENRGEEFVPRWFTKGRDEVTGEEYWVYNGEYWNRRKERNWEGCEDIF